MIIGIDPGHGGENLGCEAEGFVEKNYVLNLADYLRHALRPFFFEVVVTRDWDTDVRLDERGKRTEGCEFVIVLHVNAFPGKPNIHGAEFYYLRGDEVAGKVAHVMARNTPEELRAGNLGGRVRTAFNDPTHDRDDWLQRPINVLEPHKCPTVLVEAFYASNPADLQFGTSRPRS